MTKEIDFFLMAMLLGCISYFMQFIMPTPYHLTAFVLAGGGIGLGWIRKMDEPEEAK